VRVFVCACACVCVCVCVCVCACACVCVYIYYIYMCVCVCVYICICKHRIIIWLCNSLSPAYVSHKSQTGDMTYQYVWRDSFMYEWHDTSTFVAQLINIYVTLSYVTWRIHIFDVTRPDVWHDAFACVIRLIHKCDMSHWYAWHDLFMCVTWLIHVCDLTHPCGWQNKWWHVTHKTRRCHLTHTNRVCHVYMNASCHT